MTFLLLSPQAQLPSSSKVMLTGSAVDVAMVGGQSCASYLQFHGRRAGEQSREAQLLRSSYL